MKLLKNKILSAAMASLFCFGSAFPGVFAAPQSALSGNNAAHFISGKVKGDFDLTGEAYSRFVSGFSVVSGKNSGITDLNGAFKIPCDGSSLIIKRNDCLTREVHIQAGSEDIILNNPIEMWAGDVATGGKQDGSINMLDVMSIASAFGSVKNDAKYNEICDFNKDDSVNMSDIMLGVRHFNKTSKDYPEYIDLPSPTNTPTCSPTPTVTVTPTFTPKAEPILREASVEPPKGLSANRVPMFFTISSDNNPSAEGIKWMSDIVASRKNPEGTGSSKTYDGSKGSMTFLSSGKYLADTGAALKEAFSLGHEIGSTGFTLAAGTSTSQTGWNDEIKKNIDAMEGLGIPRTSIMGFRYPSLQYNSSTFIAVKSSELLYDSTLDDGFMNIQDGTNCLWPYTLDYGYPNDDLKPIVPKIKGMWEIPLKALIIPDDGVCVKYGVNGGLRRKLSGVSYPEFPRFSKIDEKGKVMGSDYLLWKDCNLTPSEWLATMKYNFDLSYNGNRSPFTLWCKSEIYAGTSDNYAWRTTPGERRNAMSEFLEYVLKNECTRLASHNKVLEWLKDPVEIGNAKEPMVYPTYTPQPAVPKKPFPQTTSYQGCIKPSDVTQGEMNESIKAVYEYWKKSYLKKSNGCTPGGGFYINEPPTSFNPSDRIYSTNQGYAMIIFALMAGYDKDAKTYYDGIYNMYNNHRSKVNTNLMSFIIGATENTYQDEDSITEGDLDIAYSLLLADKQWGSNGHINYLQEAKRMITNGIKAGEINKKTYRTMTGDRPESYFEGNNDDSCSSEWATGHFSAFKAATGDSVWDKASKSVYSNIDYITKNYSVDTGLVPGIITGATPRPKDYQISVPSEEYTYYASRFPMRLAEDYMTTGNEAAKSAIDKTLNWLKQAVGNDPSRISAGYELNGTPLYYNLNDDYRFDGRPIFDSNGKPTNCRIVQDIAFTAPFVAASSVNSSNQEFLNGGWKIMKDRKEGNAFSDSVNLMCMLMISGNWWKPY